MKVTTFRPDLRHEIGARIASWKLRRISSTVAALPDAIRLRSPFVKSSLRKHTP